MKNAKPALSQLSRTLTVYKAGDPMPSAGQVVTYLAIAIIGWVVLEQLRFAMKRRTVSGKMIPWPSRPVPFLGGLIEMVKDPYAFWERQRVFAERGVSYNSLFGQFVLRLAAVRPC